MRIRHKSGIVLCGTIVVFVGVFYFALSSILTNRFAEIETSETARDIQRANLALDAEVERLDETNLDYAKWDDAYKYVIDHNQEFIASNFVGSALGLDFVLIVDQQGSVVYLNATNESTKQDLQLPRGFVEQMSGVTSQFHFSHPEDGIKGYISIQGEPMIISARPITTSQREGPVRGTLVMGRVLDEAYVDRIKERTRLMIKVDPIASIADRGALPHGWFGPSMPTNTTAITPLSTDQTEGSILKADVFDRPSFVLKITVPRLVYRQSLVAIQSLLGALTIFGVLLILVVMLMMERFILSRISRLAESLRNVRKSGKIADILELGGDDELTEFSHALHGAFGEISRSEDRLKSEREKLNTILQSIGEGVFVVGSDRKIILANHKTEGLSGYSAEEMIGRMYQDRLPFRFESDLSERVDCIEKAFKTGKTVEPTKSIALERKDGAMIPISCAAAPIRDVNGKIVGCVVAFRDVSHEREVNRLRSELVSIASHQLRTPLAGIKWILELLVSGQVGKLSKDQRSYLQQITASNDRMIMLVEDLLEVSHIETGRKFTIVLNSADLMPVLRSVVDEQRPQADIKQIGLTIDGSSAQSCTVEMDAEKIREVVANLVGNAIKYTPHNGSVTLSLACGPKASAVVSVRDTGIGIPDAQQKSVFERFFRADNAQSSEATGTGLGLYIAKSIIEAHKGRIWFESKENKGSTFYFSLPKSEAKTTVNKAKK